MDALQSYYAQLVFLFSNLTWTGVIDLLLVTLAFYLVLSLLRRSSAAFLLREVVAVVVGLFIITTLLPLPVFDWLVRAFLLAILVATPIIFQAQIRQFLSRVSRSAGIGRAARQSAAESVIPEIVHAAENMSATRTGALIVLEGNDPLDDILQSGISSEGRVTSELLQSIFYPGTPLHDGAVIIRTDRVQSAGCVLPLTQQFLQAEKRLGTRHRAAVGLSEISDALIVLVSEETGHIGIAQNGQLERPLNSAELRDRLQDFYAPTMNNHTTTLSLLTLAKELARHSWRSAAVTSPGQMFSNLGVLLMSLALTFVVWSFVLEQTNAIELVRVEGIPLRVENMPPNTKLIPPPPTAVSAIIQTPKDVLPTLSASSFQAVIHIDSQKPGLYRLPVEIVSGVKQVRVVSAEPQAIDLELTPIISRTVPVNVNIPDPQNLSPAYELVGTPAATPASVQVLGPEPLVNTVSAVQASVSVANTNTSVRENRPLKAVDDEGREVTGVTVVPEQARVNVSVRQRLNASDVSVQAAIVGSPPAGYQLQQVSVEPSSVTLQGSTEQLSTVGSVVNTLPVDIGQITGVVTLQTPLDLPPNTQALDSNGNSTKTVAVTVRVTPLSGNESLSRPVKLVEASEAITYTVNPKLVDLLLTGPVPVLEKIKADPELIQVLVNVGAVRRGQTVNLTPEVVAPAEVKAQLAPPSVQVAAQ